MEENLRILKMIEEGTVTAEQALELLKTMAGENAAETDAVKPDAAAEEAADSYDKNLFKVIVDDPRGDKVNIQFPVGAIKKILNVTGTLPIQGKELQGIDLSEMMEAVSACLDEKMEGDFVNVKGADGTTVRIFVDKDN